MLCKRVGTGRKNEVGIRDVKLLAAFLAPINQLSDVAFGRDGELRTSL